MISTRIAGASDARRISELLKANASARRGMLMVQWSVKESKSALRAAKDRHRNRRGRHIALGLRSSKDSTMLRE
jgi:hypothetical protein